jgi:pyruvate dehydrogenase E1 component
VGVSDYMRAVPDQISQWVPGDWSSLGTDGFGLSDTRSALRRHFHVDAASITLAVLTQLARRGEVKPETVRDAIAHYHLKNGVTEVGAQPTPESNETQSMGF